MTGPMGERLWWGNQGGIHWGPITTRMEADFITFEERKLPKMGPVRFNNSEIDQLAKALRGNTSGDGETLQQFHPGIVHYPQEEEREALHISTFTQTASLIEPSKLAPVGPPTGDHAKVKEYPEGFTAVGPPTGDFVSEKNFTEKVTAV